MVLARLGGIQKTLLRQTCKGNAYAPRQVHARQPLNVPVYRLSNREPDRSSPETDWFAVELLAELESQFDSDERLKAIDDANVDFEITFGGSLSSRKSLLGAGGRKGSSR
jgi:hypothetical protein